MTEVRHRRKMIGTLVLWSAYVATWTTITGSGPELFAVWWLAGTIALGSLWVALRPRLRQDVTSTAPSSSPLGQAGASSTSPAEPLDEAVGR